MKKFRFVLILLTFVLLSLCVGFGCDGCNKNPDPPSGVTVEGFNVKESITAELKVGETQSLISVSDFLVNTSTITDSLGNGYTAQDLTVKVLDGTGAEITLTDGSFYALVGNTYTVQFLLVTNDGTTFTKQGELVVFNTTVEGFNVKETITLELNANETQKSVSVNDFLENVSIITDSSGNQYDAQDLTVKVFDNLQNEIAVTDGVFAITKDNKYTVCFSLVTQNGSVFTEQGELKVLNVISEYLNGIIKDNSVNLGLTDILSVNVYQYILNDGGDDLTLADSFGVKSTVKAVAVDVTDVYGTFVNKETGLVDLTKYDGIYCITTENDNTKKHYYFERAIDGKITWNNIASVFGVGVSGLYEDTSYNGSGTLSVADVSGLNNDHKYYDEKDNYFVFKSSFEKESALVDGQNGFNLKLYPVHGKGYYEEILAKTDVAFLMRYYLALDDENAPEDEQFSFYANMGYNDLGQVTYDDAHCWGNDVSDADVTARIRTGKVNLSDLVERWDNVISSTLGGGFLGFNELNTNATYTGAFSLYFGGLTVVSGAEYKIERYFEYPAGINIYYQSETGTTYATAPYGEYIEFVPDVYAEYRLSEGHKNNVLAGYNDGGLVIKVYYEYYLESTEYTVNVYLEDDNGEFVRDANYSYVKDGPFMETVEYDQVDIIGYLFDADHEGAVNSGLNRYQLVLNVYYERDPNWTISIQTLGGVQTGDTFNLQVKNIEQFKIIQYLLHDGGSPLVLKDALDTEFTVKAYAYDVTDKYKHLVNLTTGVIDTTELSGIFTVTAIGKTDLNKNIRQDVTFEQGKLDKFVWNNLDVEESYNVRDRWCDNYQGTGTLGSADPKDAVIANREGEYFVFNGNASDGKTWGLKVYPVHSVEFFKAMLEVNPDYEFTFDFYYEAEGYQYQNSNFGNFYLHIYDREVLSRLDSKVNETWHSSNSVSLQTFVNNYAYATKNTSHSTGYFLGTSYMSVIGEYKVYFGNFKLTRASYKVEYYLDYELDDTISKRVMEDLGKSVAIDKIPYLQGYDFDIDNVNNVLSGVNDGTLVLKLYYYSVNENVIYINGLNTTSTIDLGLTNFKTVKITQYVVRSDGEELLIKDKDGNDVIINAMGVDVTETYKSKINFTTGIVDTTGLDGIFCIRAIDGLDRATVYVEQVSVGTFVWNNIKETTVSADYVGAWGSTEYTGDGILSIVEEGDSILDGKTGIYWKSVSSMPTGENTATGVRIYPVHTFSYYDTFYHEAKVYVNFTYDSDGIDRNESLYMKAGLYMDDANIVGIQDNANYKWRKDGVWLSESFVIDSTAYERAISQDADYLGRIIQVGMAMNEMLGDNLTLYFGGITSSPTRTVYNVEIYTNEGDGNFALNDELSYQTVGEYGELTVDVPEIEGYIYREGHKNEVLSGFNDTTLVIKLYYDKDLSVKTYQTVKGLRNDETLSLPFGNITEFALIQYVVRDDGEDITLWSDNGEEVIVKAIGVDVTSVYSDIVNLTTGVVDTSALDGIFKLKAVSGNNVHFVTFEQYVEGQFTWNNVSIDNSSNATGSLVGCYGETPYTGDGVLSVQTADTDNLLSGKDGVYWKSVSSMPTDGVDEEAVGIRVFPVHTFNYYDTLWNNKTVSLEFYFAGDDTVGNETLFIKGAIYLNDDLSASELGNYKWRQDNKWLSATFIIDSMAYSRATAMTEMLGRMVGIHRATSEMLGDNLTLYVGGFTVVDGDN